ncbi:Serine/threonine-protein kinase [Quillaja saponaria]|uniref:Serine/threonine-protein kinase n=1 Tax=Quillaja saponaria TaxID=32244 RepID=A0AAD7VFS9_QUISA|nr:Serine/threonine-protein kinase [Quillaja saponaria]
MGCVQAKPSTNSPPRGLERLKLENGYVGNGGIAGNRRSTGQRYAKKESGRLYRDEPRKYNIGFANGDGQSQGSNFGGKGEGGDEGKRYGDHKDGKLSKHDRDGELVDGWPKWLTDNVPREVLAVLIPRSAESYRMLDKVGQGTYSNVYKARDRYTGKIVALKKVRFDTSEPESVKFMAREIMILQKLDHPNIVKLEGLATSRLQYSLYLVFDFMQSDLGRIISLTEERLTEPQVKCYMLQLLSGLQHCHDRGILHRDIKGSNLLIDKNGVLKIADFGLANYYTPKNKRPMTSRVVTLWYRAPELLLGATDYGVGIDLWSAGCLLAEMFTGTPIMPGRTEVEQLHRIFRLCGTPSEEYWKKLKLSTTFRPPKSYKPSLVETFKDFPVSSLGLLSTLLALDPHYRGSASLALQNQFFSTSPLACNLSGLPVINNEDDEQNQASEQIKYMNSTMKRRSRTHRERNRKDLRFERLVGDTVAFKEELKQNAETYVPSEGPGSTTSSTSPSVNTAGPKDNSHLFLPPLISSYPKLLPEGGDHSNGGENIRILPTSFPKSKSRANNKKDDNVFGLNQINRSASTREFRNLSPRDHLGLFAIQDD